MSACSLPTKQPTRPQPSCGACSRVDAFASAAVGCTVVGGGWGALAVRTHRRTSPRRRVVLEIGDRLRAACPAFRYVDRLLRNRPAEFGEGLLIKRLSTALMKSA